MGGDLVIFAFLASISPLVSFCSILPFSLYHAIKMAQFLIVAWFGMYHSDR